MLLIVGLGNPGQEYSGTRHNLGFEVVDKLAEQLGLDFKSDKYAVGELAKNDRLALLKPLTFVNKSGSSVGHISETLKINQDHIWLIHDDAEVPFGEVRVKQGGTSGGHNGIKSVDETIGTDYWRIRIGIGRDSRFGDLSDYVLAHFSPSEQKHLPTIIDQVVSYLIQSIDEQKLTAGSLNFNAEKRH